MTPSIEYPVLGNSFSRVATFQGLSPADPGPVAAGESSRPPTNPLEGIVRLVQSNDRLFAERDALLLKLGQARAYLADPTCNRNFATAYLSHLKLKYSSVVALLRANRLEARRIVGGLDRGTVGAA